MIELVTFDDLASLLELEKLDIEEYPALNVIRDSVVAAIESYIGRELELGQRSETLYAGTYPERMIGLKGLPVQSIGAVACDSGLPVTATIQSYGVRLDTGIRNCRVVVIYTGGFAADAIPSGIRRAALIQTAYEFQAKDHIGAETVSTEGGAVTRPALQLLPEVRRMLDPFKHPLKLN